MKNFLLRQVAKHKLKDVPEAQREQILSMMEKNPKLMQTIGEEIEKRTKNGEGQMKATMEVMKKYRDELVALQK